MVLPSSKIREKLRHDFQSLERGSRFTSERPTVMTLRELLEQSAQVHGNRVALRFKGGGAWQTRTYSDLLARVRLVAEFLGGLSLKPDDRVALLLPNCPEWPEIYFGITALGLIAVPMDAKLRAQEVAFILRDSGARAIFCDASSMLLLNGLLTQLPDLASVVGIGLQSLPSTVPQSPRWFSYEQIPAQIHSAPSCAYDRFQPQPAALASLLYTSGTTGQPKAAMLTHDNFISNAAAMCRMIDVWPDDNFLVVLPLHHALAFSACLLVPLYSGSSISFVESLKTIGDDMRATAATALIGVPLLLEKMYRRMMEGLRENKVGWLLFKLGILGPVTRSIRAKLGGRLRLLVTGGAPCDAQLVRGYARLGFTVLEGYGLTEAAPVVTLNPLERPKPGSVGIPLPNVEVCLFETNAEGVGEIGVRGPNVMRGYYNKPEATAAVFRDGWLLTGDLGCRDADGYFTITGRKKSLIVNREGKNINPEEIEAQVLKYPLIREALALGYREPGERVGEHVGLIIVPDAEAIAAQAAEEHRALTDADIEQLLRTGIKRVLQAISDYKHPRRIVIRREEFEKTSTGKVKRFLYRMP